MFRRNETIDRPPPPRQEHAHENLVAFTFPRTKVMASNLRLEDYLALHVRPYVLESHSRGLEKNSLISE